MNTDLYIVVEIWHEGLGYRITNIWKDNDGCYLDIKYTGDGNALSVNIKDIQFDSHTHGGFKVRHMIRCLMGNVTQAYYGDTIGITTVNGQIIYNA